MPEIPDLNLYLHALAARVEGEALRAIRINDPFLLRSVAPPPGEFTDRRVTALKRVGKRIVIELAEEHFIVLHLMVAGRLHWKPVPAPLRRRGALLALDFDSGTLTLTENSRKRRASLHLAAGRAALEEFDRGGLELASATLAQFSAVLLRENHTLKRALTDQHLIAGIGNAYSDEILHRARLSPMMTTARLEPREAETLFNSAKAVLAEWSGRLVEEAAGEFPEHVTAFHDGMAVHGKYRKPCPACGHPVQRIRYADNECNYCAHCQNEGRLLADRGLSRLLKSDWPRTLEELERDEHR